MLLKTAQGVDTTRCFGHFIFLYSLLKCIYFYLPLVFTAISTGPSVGGQDIFYESADWSLIGFDPTLKLKLLKF